MHISDDLAFSKVLKRIYWDYDFEPARIKSLLEGQSEGTPWLNRNAVLARMFERLSWYDLLRVFGEKELLRLLQEPFIKNLKDPFLIRKYETVRQILQGEFLSIPGWDHAHHQRLQNSLLSHRWNRPE